MKGFKRGFRIYYSSLTDEMLPKSEAPRRPVRRGRVNPAFEFIAYRLIAKPLAAFYCSIILGERIVGREKLAAERSYILMLNHNEPVGDAFTPPMITGRRHCHTVVHPDNLSLPVIGRALYYLGAIPLPESLSDVRAFRREVRAALDSGRAVAIYPEGRLWPGCSFIRPFERGAFDLAIGCDVPVFSATRVYLKKGRRLRSVVYIDGPFYPPSSGGRRERAESLSNAVRLAMEEKMQDSEILVDYRPRETE